MDEREDPPGRRAFDESNGRERGRDDGLSPTERLERLREGLNRGRRGGAAAEPARAPIDPPRPVDDLARPGDMTEVVLSDENDAPAPREKARWREGRGPRAAGRADDADFYVDFGFGGALAQREEPASSEWARAPEPASELERRRRRRVEPELKSPPPVEDDRTEPRSLAAEFEEPPVAEPARDVSLDAGFEPSGEPNPEPSREPVHEPSPAPETELRLVSSSPSAEKRREEPEVEKPRAVRSRRDAESFDDEIEPQPPRQPRSSRGRGGVAATIDDTMWSDPGDFSDTPPFESGGPRERAPANEDASASAQEASAVARDEPSVDARAVEPDIGLSARDASPFDASDVGPAIRPVDDDAAKSAPEDGPQAIRSSGVRLRDGRSVEAPVTAVTPLDPLAEAEWDMTPDDADASRKRAFNEAARQVEERRALRGGGTGLFALAERLLAIRYLRARRKEGFISVIAALSLLGIALGVAILIIVMSVMNGFRAELVSKIVGVNGHLMVMSLSDDFTDYRDIADRVRAVPGVTRAAPLVEAQAYASAPRAGSGVLVRGVSKEDMLTLDKVSVNPEFSMGSLAAFEGDAGVAIGQRLALRLGLNIGDNISLLSPRGPATPFGVVPRKKSYRILYIFKVGMANYDDQVVFMPLFEAQKFFNKNGGVDAIEVMVATPERLTGYREDIEAAAGRPIVIGDWIERNRSLIGALRTERTVMFLILSFLILIASLIIISGMIMLVKEKGKDIAILRTMGMTRWAVLRVFFMCGASIGAVGTAAGVILGLLFCYNISYIENAVSYLANGDVFPEDVYILSALPAQVHTSDVMMTVGISLGLSFLATLYPAWRAARLDPVEALRNE